MGHWHWKNSGFWTFLCAFVHKSYASDFKEPYLHNERLEFVGDAALGAVIAKALFLNFPWMQESTMTLYKIALVREETLAEVAQKIWLNQQIFISKGEEKIKDVKKHPLLLMLWKRWSDISIWIWGLMLQRSLFLKIFIPKLRR